MPSSDDVRHGAGAPGAGGSPRYPRLLSPFRLGGLALRNRIVMSPMATFALCGPDGHSTARQRAYYAARARAGVGLVRVEGAIVHPSGASFAPALRIDDDRYVPALGALAVAIKDEGAAAILQLHHGGRAAPSRLTGRPPMAPSPVRGPRHDEWPREMTRAEIDEIADAFGQAAGRARRAGFDGVELQMGASYLFLGFLSPAQNRRRDAYGGDLAGRLRFPLRVVERIRQAVGPDYVIGARVPTMEYEEGGIELREGLEIARALERAGLAYLDAYVGYGHRQAVDSPLTMGEGQAGLADLAAALRATVAVPVMVAGRFLSLAAAEAALAAGKADLVAFGRALLADPELVPKSLRGEAHRVVPCVGSEACRQSSGAGRCFLNAASGHELDGDVGRAPVPRRVLVRGAGIPGLQFARIARLRGHAVTVALAGRPFGGLLALRARVPGAEEAGRGVAFYRRALAELGVAVVAEAGPGEEYDLVVEGRPGPPRPGAVPGPAGGGPAGEAILDGRVDLAALGQRLAVLGTGLFAAEAGLFLAGAGKDVTVLVPEAAPMADAHPWTAGKTRLRLAACGGRIVGGLSAVASEERMASVGAGDAGERLGPFDGFVTAWGWEEPSAPPGGLAVGDAWDALGLLRAGEAAIQQARTV